MKYTIKDIAKNCDVSVSLVSRIINNDDTLRVSKEKRERVLKEVENLKYIPNYFAKNLANSTIKEKKNIKIGYITYKAATRQKYHPYFDEIIEGISSNLQSQGYQIINYFIDEVVDLFKKGKHLHEKILDGLILFGSIPSELANYLNKEAKFLASIYGDEIPNADFVGSDITLSLNQAFDYVRNNGFTSFGFITGGDQKREYAAIEYAKSIGLTLDEDFYYNCRFDSNYAYVETIKKIKSYKVPNLIICMNDEMAIGVENALLDQGYKIPEDVSIIGHDDIRRASLCRVPLTTVRIYKNEIGRLISDILIERIDSKRKFPIRVLVPTELIIRESVKKRV